MIAMAAAVDDQPVHDAPNNGSNNKAPSSSSIKPSVTRKSLPNISTANRKAGQRISRHKASNSGLGGDDDDMFNPDDHSVFSSSTDRSKIVAKKLERDRSKRDGEKHRADNKASIFGSMDKYLDATLDEKIIEKPGRHVRRKSTGNAEAQQGRLDRFVQKEANSASNKKRGDERSLFSGQTTTSGQTFNSSDSTERINNRTIPVPMSPTPKNRPTATIHEVGTPTKSTSRTKRSVSPHKSRRRSRSPKQLTPRSSQQQQQQQQQKDQPEPGLATLLAGVDNNGISVRSPGKSPSSVRSSNRRRHRDDGTSVVSSASATSRRHHRSSSRKRGEGGDGTPRKDQDDKSVTSNTRRISRRSSVSSLPVYDPNGEDDEGTIVTLDTTASESQRRRSGSRSRSRRHRSGSRESKSRSSRSRSKESTRKDGSHSKSSSSSSGRHRSRSRDGGSSNNNNNKKGEQQEAENEKKRPTRRSQVERMRDSSNQLSRDGGSQANSDDMSQTTELTASQNLPASLSYHVQPESQAPPPSPPATSSSGTRPLAQQQASRSTMQHRRGSIGVPVSSAAVEREIENSKTFSIEKEVRDEPSGDARRRRASLDLNRTSSSSLETDNPDKTSPSQIGGMDTDLQKFFGSDSSSDDEDGDTLGAMARRQAMGEGAPVVCASLSMSESGQIVVLQEMFNDANASFVSTDTMGTEYTAANTLVDAAMGKLKSSPKATPNPGGGRRASIVLTAESIALAAYDDDDDDDDDKSGSDGESVKIEDIKVPDLSANSANDVKKCNNEKMNSSDGSLDPGLLVRVQAQPPSPPQETSQSILKKPDHISATFETSAKSTGSAGLLSPYKKRVSWDKGSNPNGSPGKHNVRDKRKTIDKKDKIKNKVKEPSPATAPAKKPEKRRCSIYDQLGDMSCGSLDLWDAEQNDDSQDDFDDGDDDNTFIDDDDDDGTYIEGETADDKDPSDVKSRKKKKKLKLKKFLKLPKKNKNKNKSVQPEENEIETGPADYEEDLLDEEAVGEIATTDGVHGDGETSQVGPPTQAGKSTVKDGTNAAYLSPEALSLWDSGDEDDDDDDNTFVSGGSGDDVEDDGTYVEGATDNPEQHPGVKPSKKKKRLKLKKLLKISKGNKNKNKNKDAQPGAAVAGDVSKTPSVDNNVGIASTTNKVHDDGETSQVGPPTQAGKSTAQDATNAAYLSPEALSLWDSGDEDGDDDDNTFVSGGSGDDIEDDGTYVEGVTDNPEQHPGVKPVKKKKKLKLKKLLQISKGYKKKNRDTQPGEATGGIAEAPTKAGSAVEEIQPEEVVEPNNDDKRQDDESNVSPQIDNPTEESQQPPPPPPPPPPPLDSDMLLTPGTPGYGGDDYEEIGASYEIPLAEGDNDHNKSKSGSSGSSRRTSRRKSLSSTSSASSSSSPRHSPSSTKRSNRVSRHRSSSSKARSRSRSRQRRADDENSLNDNASVASKSSNKSTRGSKRPSRRSSMASRSSVDSGMNDSYSSLGQNKQKGRRSSKSNPSEDDGTVDGSVTTTPRRRSGDSRKMKYLTEKDVQPTGQPTDERPTTTTDNLLLSPRRRTSYLPHNVTKKQSDESNSRKSSIDSSLDKFLEMLDKASGSVPIIKDDGRSVSSAIMNKEQEKRMEDKEEKEAFIRRFDMSNHSASKEETVAALSADSQSSGREELTRSMSTQDMNRPVISLRKTHFSNKLKQMNVNF